MKQIQNKERILNPNCSESVFRFHTTEPVNMQKILQAIADEIGANNTEYFKGQKVKLLKTAEEYESKTILRGCAGLGDNDAVIEVHKDDGFFTLNIGNNDISANTTNWTGIINALDIRAEEAEFDKELRDIARDCTCGMDFGIGGPDEKFRVNNNYIWYRTKEYNEKKKTYVPIKIKLDVKTLVGLGVALKDRMRDMSEDCGEYIRECSKKQYDALTESNTKTYTISTLLDIQEIIRDDELKNVILGLVDKYKLGE